MFVNLLELERILENQPFLEGNNCTSTDAFFEAQLHKTRDVMWDLFPHSKQWLETMKNTPDTQKPPQLEGSFLFEKIQEWKENFMVAEYLVRADQVRLRIWSPKKSDAIVVTFSPKTSARNADDVKSWDGIWISPESILVCSLSVVLDSKELTFRKIPPLHSIEFQQIPSTLQVCCDPVPGMKTHFSINYLTRWSLIEARKNITAVNESTFDESTLLLTEGLTLVRNREIVVEAYKIIQQNLKKLTFVKSSQQVQSLISELV